MNTAIKFKNAHVNTLGYRDNPKYKTRSFKANLLHVYHILAVVSSMKQVNWFIFSGIQKLVHEFSGIQNAVSEPTHGYLRKTPRQWKTHTILLPYLRSNQEIISQTSECI